MKNKIRSIQIEAQCAKYLASVLQNCQGDDKQRKTKKVSQTRDTQET